MDIQALEVILRILEDIFFIKAFAFEKIEFEN